VDQFRGGWHYEKQDAPGALEECLNLFRGRHPRGLSNFRGIENADIDMAPITVLTGANNSGKSSVMYGLLVLKNIFANPNQPLDSFFNLTRKAHAVSRSRSSGTVSISL